MENEYFAETDCERKEGDGKVKEGLAFLRKFYNERASVFSEKRRNSNSEFTGMELLQPGMARKGSAIITNGKTPINANQVIHPCMNSANYKKRVNKIGNDKIASAGGMVKDVDQPDTVGFILGMADYKPSENKSKVAMRHV